MLYVLLMTSPYMMLRMLQLVSSSVAHNVFISKWCFVALFVSVQMAHILTRLGKVMWHVKPFFNVEGSSHLFECFECLHVHDIIVHDVADVATSLHACMKKCFIKNNQNGGCTIF
jgi:hypothetical protein